MGLFDELYARIYDDPDDLEARRVLADALLELDDPHGELIMLQLTGGRAHEDRIEELLVHAERFLGPLAGLLMQPIIQNGFVRAGEPLPEAFLPEAAALRAWGTIRHLGLTVGGVPDPGVLLFSPALHALQSVSFRFSPADANALTFLEHAPPLPWDSVLLRVARDVHAESLARARSLSALRYVHAYVEGVPDGIRWLRAHASLPGHVEDLVLDGYGWRATARKGALEIEASLPEGIAAVDDFVAARLPVLVDLSRLVGVPPRQRRELEKRHKRRLKK